MNKRMKKKQMLGQKIHELECELVVLSEENMHLMNKVGERHEEICAKNVEQTNKEFESIKKELKRSKKSFFKR